MTKNVLVNVPNEGETSISREIVSKWQPTDKTRIGETVFFCVDGMFLSMSATEFDNVFGPVAQWIERLPSKQ